MDKLESQIREADEASRILNAPLYEQSFEDVRQALQRQLEATPTTAEGDGEARDLRQRLQCLAQVKAALSYRIDSGKLARRELSMREKASNTGRRIAKTLFNANGAR